MQFDFHSHETGLLLLGMAGLVEQEAVRLLLSTDPSSVLSGIFGSMVLASVVPAAVRHEKGKKDDESQ